MAETLELAAEFIAGHPDAPPIAVMTYLNPMMRMGLDRLAVRAAEAGVSGFIVPDMPPDNPMATRWLAASDALGIDTVFLAAPTSTPERLERVAGASKGFVYVVSSLGVTGERSEVAAGLAAPVARVREHTTLPIAVGSGVGTAEQAAEVAKIADGAVVGSAIVRRQGDVEALEAFVRELVAGVQQG